MGRETVGKVSSDLLQRDVYGDITAGEQMQESLVDYEKNLFDAVAHGKTLFAAGDFFVVVLTKREGLMLNVLRNYFIPRRSCPTPNYDQTVYHFHRDEERLEYLWSLPSPVAIKNLLVHKHEMDPSFFQLLKFVIDFLDGSLDKKAMFLNKEIVHADGRIETGRYTGRV